MTKRIFYTVFIVAIGVFFSSLILFITVLYEYFSGVQRDQLLIQTELAAQGVQNEGIKYLEGLSADHCRITWIGRDGIVLYDSASDIGEMENHFQREEVQDAFAEGYGTGARYSSTLTERYFYSAKRLPDGTVLRLSAIQNSLFMLILGMLQPIGIIFLAMVAVSIILALRLSKNIVRPLNELNLDKPLENDGYDEFVPLLRRIDIQQREIKRQKGELKQMKNEFEVLTSSMAEGLILMNCSGTILSINHAAAKLFDTDRSCTGENILSLNRNQDLAGVLYRAKNGEPAETVMDFSYGRYQVDASPVSAGGKVSGIVLLLLDVTEKEKAEQMRREFTANVSHELKTPLHTISGSAELMAGGLVKPEDIAVFSERIYAESRRMIRLVEDIIKLSHLDEGASDMNWEKVDLYLLADETVKLLLPEAEKAEVTLELHGETTCIYGIRQLLQGIVYNLCDNAVKYNRRGGTVRVDIRKKDGFSVLSVADSGIGVSAEHQERIFERFYRVDKSHSKEIGGTGLGLSIVKHASKLHGAQIDIHSIPDSGTVITVRFP